MPTLFQLTAEILAAYDGVDEAQGEITPEMDAALGTLQEAEHVKLDAYYALIRTVKMEADAADAEVKKWADRRDARYRLGESLKARVYAHMTATGQAKITTLQGNVFAVQANGGKRPLKMHTDDAKEIPADYRKVVILADVEKIRAELESGEPLEFAHLEERGTHLRIR